MKTTRTLVALAGLAFSTSAMATLTLQDDADRDGIGDIFFQGGSNLAYWKLIPNPDDIGQYPAPVYGGDRYAGYAGFGYRVVAISDFTGDGSADVLWTNGAQLKMWINNGSGSYTPRAAGSYGGGWEPFAARDLNGDRKSDILFRGGTHLAYRLMDGASTIDDSYFGNGGAGYQVIALEDFDSDGKADVVWANGSQLKAWFSTCAFCPIAIGSYGGGWEPFAAGDVNGNGTPDILFRGSTHLAYWSMDKARVLGSFYLGDGGAGFRVFAVSDHNRDGAADIAWTNGSQIKLWHNDVFEDQYYSPIDLNSYGGGWEPVDMLIRN